MTERGQHSRELSFEDWESYRKMRRSAEAAHRYLHASREGGSGERRLHERMALWHGILLDRACEVALTPDHLLQLWPPGVSVDVRYGLQAAIRMIHATLPFTPDERDRLAEPLGTFLDRYPAVESDELATHEPELVNRWREWLWTDELGIPQTRAEALGPSAMLDTGYQALAAHLGDILADPMSEPM